MERITRIYFLDFHLECHQLERHTNYRSDLMIQCNVSYWERITINSSYPFASIHICFIGFDHVMKVVVQQWWICLPQQYTTHKLWMMTMIFRNLYLNHCTIIFRSPPKKGRVYERCFIEQNKNINLLRSQNYPMDHPKHIQANNWQMERV